MFKPYALKTCLETTLNNDVCISFVSGADGRLVAFAGDKTQANLLSAVMDYTMSVYNKATEVPITKTLMMETKDKKFVVGINVLDFMVCFVGNPGCSGPIICQQV